MNKLIGKMVEVKEGFHKGDWGIVKIYDGDYYHVAMFGDENECCVFDRAELRLPRRNG